MKNQNDIEHQINLYKNEINKVSSIIDKNNSKINESDKSLYLNIKKKTENTVKDNFELSNFKINSDKAINPLKTNKLNDISNLYQLIFNKAEESKYVDNNKIQDEIMKNSSRLTSNKLKNLPISLLSYKETQKADLFNQQPFFYNFKNDFPVYEK